jgi:quinol monooxygenase YgiN
MSTAVSWVIKFSINSGQRGAFVSLMEEMVEGTMADEPGALAYEWFIADDDRTVHIYERYADSDATMVHLGNFGQKYAERVMAISEVTGFSVYGDASDAVRGALGPFGAEFLGTLGGFHR